MLQDSKVWKSWYSKGAKAEGVWAPFPTQVPVKIVVPTAQKEPVTWRYTFEKPSDSWNNPNFDDSTWQTGPAGFGMEGTPGAVVRTKWSTSDIWIRRQFDLSTNVLKNPRLLLHYDEDAEVYINGVLAAQTQGYVQNYEELMLRLMDLRH
jgi:hypothetical protein